MPIGHDWWDIPFDNNHTYVDDPSYGGYSQGFGVDFQGRNVWPGFDAYGYPTDDRTTRHNNRRSHMYNTIDDLIEKWTTGQSGYGAENGYGGPYRGWNGYGGQMPSWADSSYGGAFTGGAQYGYDPYDNYGGGFGGYGGYDDYGYGRGYSGGYGYY